MNLRKYRLSIGNKEYKAEVIEFTSERARVTVNGAEYEVKLVDFGRPDEGESIIRRPVTDSPRSVTRTVETAKAPQKMNGSEGVRAPLPGMIVDVLAAEGDTVKAGQNLILMEAMKMENQVQAPHDGTVKKVFVGKGDTVAEGDLLVELARPLHTTL